MVWLIDNDEMIAYGIYVNPKKTNMIAIGWGKIKGDWWYEKDPTTAKFFGMRKRKSEGSDITRYGLYIGRLALVFMKKDEGESESK